MKLHDKRSPAHGGYVITPQDMPDIAVEPGADFDVDDDELAASLLQQEDNYEQAGGKPTQTQPDTSEEEE